MHRLLVSVVVFCALSASTIRGQSKGDAVPKPTPSIPADTLFVFAPSRPLMEVKENDVIKRSMGFDVTFGTNGLGFGGFFQRNIKGNLSYSVNLLVSGARRTDEFEAYDPTTGRIFIPGKVNRLYSFPLSIALQHRLFSETLSESFRPFVALGAGPSLILSLPYEKPFFSSFGSSNSFIRFNTYVGVGVNLGASRSGMYGLSLRYYYIPFGGAGLESIQGYPISDFGGPFLSLWIGFPG